ncbi:MAG: D-alanyl-D-alanine carboxypeptidase [Clostridia bacterium]|nr:D-alanyl-D-alanine carboxypeptidase [Clostridia bacterium]
MTKKRHAAVGVFRAVSFFFALVLSVSALAVLPPKAFADEPPVLEKVGSACLYNVESDAVLFEFNAEEPVRPTSTVKLMTAIVAFENSPDLGKQVTVTEKMLESVRGNAIGFAVGETVTVEQALYCLLVNNANDAAMILAYAVAGSEEAFVRMMNEKAETLSAWNTKYTNCTGMHSEDSFTTAADTLKIARCAYSIDRLVGMTGTGHYVMDATNFSEARDVYNRNCLVSKYYKDEYYYDGVIGLNAGSTPQGGYCAVAAARDPENTVTYISVVMNAETDDDNMYNYRGTAALLDWAFASFGYREVISKKQVVCEIPVRLSSTHDYVTLVPADSLTVFLPSDVDIENDVTISCRTESDFLDAPVKLGQKAGVAMVTYQDRMLGTVDLIATSDVSRSELLFFMERTKSFIRSPFFIATVVSLVVFTVLYVLIKARFSQKRLRQRVPSSRGRRYR